MHLLTSLLFAIAANTDNFVVGIAYGINKIRIGILTNLVVAAVSCTGTYLSMLTGRIIYSFLPKNITHIMGSSILIFLGLWYLSTSIRKNSKEKDTEIEALLKNRNLLRYYRRHHNNLENLNIKEALLLSSALTINNIGLGIGASITGLNITFTAFCTFIFSILSILTGNFLGNTSFFRALGKHAYIISAILLIALGLYQLCT